MTNHRFSRLSTIRSQEIAQNRALNCPMRRHMGTSSTTKGRSSPEHYLNTVSSPAVPPGGRKAALHGANAFGILEQKCRHASKNTRAHAPRTSKPPLLAPAQCTAPDDAITSHAPAGCASTVPKSPSLPLNDLLCVSSFCMM